MPKSKIKSREVHLKRRPEGRPSLDDFALTEVDIGEPRAGEFLVRNLWMSVDPYMRGRMRQRKSYIPSFEIGKPLEGGCVGEVVASNHDSFAEGDHVAGMLGWREYWISDGSGVEKVDPELAPIQSYLGALGMPGLTAYAGISRIADVKQGERVFVSGAAGAVGSIACQLARIKGARVAGAAGSDTKVQWLLDEAGLDEAFNYKKVADLSRKLAEVFPEGIDVYFDNVGGPHLEAALHNMKSFGRIAACGMISDYNAVSAPPGPSNLFQIIIKRLTMRGFLVFDHNDLRETFLREMHNWVRDGKIKWKETVVKGLENAPRAFLGLFKGENLGKMLVKIDPDT